MIIARINGLQVGLAVDKAQQLAIFCMSAWLCGHRKGAGD
jgi:hypothetical protein